MSDYIFDHWVVNGQFKSWRPLDYITNKNKSAKSYIKYMLIRLQKMFKYKNLPDSIPSNILELYLLYNGTCFITKEKGDLYAFIGGAGGQPDPYYRPTVYTVANPALKISRNYDIDKDGILVRNDSFWEGLYPLMARYAGLMAENLLTIRTADIMLRIVALITSPKDKTKEAAEIYLKKIEKGELGIIAESRFLEGVQMQSPPSNNGSYLTQFIELQQYLKGSFFNEIGLNANFNMKREAIGEDESSLNEDSLMPLCEDMLKCRREDIKKVNEMYGLDISVDFDSTWAENVLQRELELQKKEAEVLSQLTNGSDFNGGNSSNELERDIAKFDESGESIIDNDENDESISSISVSGESGASSESVESHELSDGDSTGYSNTCSNIDNECNAGSEKQLEVNINIISQLIEGSDENGRKESVNATIVESGTISDDNESVDNELQSVDED